MAMKPLQGSQKEKGHDIGHALTANSCERVNSVEYVHRRSP